MVCQSTLQLYLTFSADAIMLKKNAPENMKNPPSKGAYLSLFWFFPVLPKWPCLPRQLKTHIFFSIFPILGTNLCLQLPKKMRERSNCLVAVKAKNTEERANFEDQELLVRPVPPLVRPPPAAPKLTPPPPAPLLFAASACRSSDMAAKVPPEIIKAIST